MRILLVQNDFSKFSWLILMKSKDWSEKITSNVDLILFLVAWETTESSALDLRIKVEKRGSDEIKIMDEKELNSSDAGKWFRDNWSLRQQMKKDWFRKKILGHKQNKKCFQTLLSVNEFRQTSKKWQHCLRLKHLLYFHWSIHEADQW